MKTQRYFLEVAYRGDGLSGFQIQENAPTVQSAIEEAFQTFFRRPVELTGSSRTDAGVHAYQNFFHFDWEDIWADTCIYNLNALLPANIVIASAKPVCQEAHARFDAISRCYEYVIYRRKDPFLNGLGWYYPYDVDIEILRELAAYISSQTYFEAFSKRNTQVKTYVCKIIESCWEQQGNCLTYRVEGNRFLRGMVRGLVSTMLQVARGNKTKDYMYDLFREGLFMQADFSAPPQGLFLRKVNFPDSLFL